MGADPFTTSRHLKMCIITLFLLYHKICRISISERVLRKILSRHNRWICKLFQTLILLYTKLPYCTFYSRHSAYKNLFLPRKCTIKIILPAHLKKVFNSHGNHQNKIISCTEISAHHIPRHRNSRKEYYGRY